MRRHLTVPLKSFCSCALFAALFALAPPPSLAQSAAASPAPSASTTGHSSATRIPMASRSDAGTSRAERALASVRNNPLELRDFLLRMPKGADLHNHLTGAIYAETWIREAADDNLCADLATLALLKTQAMTRSIPPQPVCGEGHARASDAFTNQHLYDSLIDAFSMRAFVPSAGNSSHDHFFDTFAKFGAVGSNHIGEWLDEVATRAAAQNEQYLELMQTPDFSKAAAIATRLGWDDDLSKFRDDLLANGLRDSIAPARAQLDDALTARNQIEHCGAHDAAPACRVQIRFLYQILRGLPKEVVFAQSVLAFEVASADPANVVGINIVMPEDGYTSMHDYALHMRMLGYLHSVYPGVHLSLHAGELAPGLVPYEGLCCHIRLAVEEAHAERIGHGVDIMWEDRPYDLLKELAAAHVMVEINLTSNDVILGVTGDRHPFPIYRRFGVPVALSTDDEGVSRIDLTHEYVRAVQSYNLSYADLKQLVRTSIEHAFLPGASLWRERDAFTRAVSACSDDSLGGKTIPARCAGFLDSSEKAQQQWELERRFRAFEASL